MKGCFYRVSVIASSHVDRHGDRFDPAALEDAARQLNTSYLPAYFDHDPRRPLPFRTVGGDVIRLPGGEVLLLAIQQYFDDTSVVPFDPDRSIPVPPMPESGVAFAWDRSYQTEEDQEALRELAAMSRSELRPYEKKALEAVSVLMLAAGIWAVGTFLDGFLSEIGADAWRKLKEVLGRRRASNEDFLFAILTEVQEGDRLLLIEAIFTRPADEDLDWLRENAPAQFERLARKVLTLPPEVRKVVVEYETKNQRFRFLYGLRRDALPVRIVLDEERSEVRPDS